MDSFSLLLRTFKTCDMTPTSSRLSSVKYLTRLKGTWTRSYESQIKTNGSYQTTATDVLRTLPRWSSCEYLRSRLYKQKVEGKGSQICLTSYRSAWKRIRKKTENRERKKLSMSTSMDVSQLVHKRPTFLNKRRGSDDTLSYRIWERGREREISRRLNVNHDMWKSSFAWQWQ